MGLRGRGPVFGVARRAKESSGARGSGGGHGVGGLDAPAPSPQLLRLPPRRARCSPWIGAHWGRQPRYTAAGAGGPPPAGAGRPPCPATRAAVPGAPTPRWRARRRRRAAPPAPPPLAAPRRRPPFRAPLYVGSVDGTAAPLCAAGLTTNGHHETKRLSRARRQPRAAKGRRRRDRWGDRRRRGARALGRARTPCTARRSPPSNGRRRQASLNSVRGARPHQRRRGPPGGRRRAPAATHCRAGRHRPGLRPVACA
jgi:hypothetical protein